MTGSDLVSKKIGDGNASRYIKPRWINANNLSTEAFDLRENPPEPYVSHFMADGEYLDERFHSAYERISKRMREFHKTNGSIAIIKIAEALDEVNDEDKPFIEFVEKGLPHCGLIYLTENQQQVLEAKATLCVLAKKQIRDLVAIRNQLVSLEEQ